jgi:hypothetical protein
VGQRHRSVEGRARRHHPVGQADPLGLRAVDAPAGEDEVHGPAVADEPGQPHGAQVDERHPEPPAVDAQHGVLGRHPQVAPQRQLQAAGHGEPLDGGDHRLGQP